MAERGQLFEPVDSKGRVVEVERGVLEFWKRERIFARTVEARAGAPVYRFYEGSPRG